MHSIMKGMATDLATKSELIRLLDEAVQNMEMKGCCMAVKDALEHIVHSGKDFIEEDLLRPAQDRYARRLLHLDPQGKYSALVMVWDTGQGTALHDHAGMWCVECVYRGKIKVVSYSHDREEGDKHWFTKETEILAGVGEAGALIPPFDHHTIENPFEDKAVTIHVYGGEMTYADCFLPEDDHYVQTRRELCYTD
jgi:predicted metal-dependent enzyme (double-stranded beta helix superfamily)